MRVRLLIDVGTNCEIVLGDGERILSTAAPAGPAFEGGAIRCGMRRPTEPSRSSSWATTTSSSAVIGDLAAARLCGSGLSTRPPSSSGSACSTPSGRLVDDQVADSSPPGWPTALAINGGAGLRAAWHACRRGPATGLPHQRDVRELQFAKAAISTGWTLLMEELGLAPRDVQQVLLAGSFGSYLSAASAVRIGLVPKLPVLRIVAAGNVAGEGAKMALL